MSSKNDKKWSHLFSTGHPQVNLIASDDPSGTSVGVVALCRPGASDTDDYAERLATLMGLDSNSIVHATDGADPTQAWSDAQQPDVGPSTAYPFA